MYFINKTDIISYNTDIQEDYGPPKTQGAARFLPFSSNKPLSN